jgi:predicted PurR-regulated permease PerM
VHDDNTRFEGVEADNIRATHQSPEEPATERRALGWLAISAFAAVLWLARPFASALLLGALMAFTLEPLYDYIVRRTGKPFLASLTTVLVSAAMVGVAVVGFVSLFVTRVVEFTSMVREQLKAEGPLRTWVDTASGWLAHLGISTTSVTSRLEAGAGMIASRFGEIARVFASGTFGALLGLFFALLAMHLVLQHWPRMVDAMIRASPLHSGHSKALLAEFQRVGRITVFGTVMTGLSQGFLAAVGFWIGGVPQPIFFGIATALASLIPAVGTMLVWIPAGLYLFAIGHPGHGILELTWGALLVVGFSDYVVRPRLVGDESTIALLVFIALFGGVEAFGLSGLILGPVLMSLAVAVLRIYVDDRHHPGGETVGRRNADSGASTSQSPHAAPPLEPNAVTDHE